MVLKPGSLVYASQCGNTVEAGVETHNAVYPVTFHHGNVNSIARGQLAFAKHEVAGALNVRNPDCVNGFYNRSI